MKYFLNLLLINLVILIPVGCGLKSNKNIGDNYKIIINKIDDSEKKQDKDILIIFFENGFDNDLLKLTLNGNTQEYFLKTDLSTGYADYINLGKLSEFKEISFRVNNGRLVKINDVKHNFILVNYEKDTILQIDFKNKIVPYM